MEERVRTLIAEDEPLAREGLADWVRDEPRLELLGCCPDGPSALEAIRRDAPGLVLMDIRMPGMSGLDVLRTLAAGPGPRPAVIFTTAYDEHALTAFELHAVDYLLKPFAHERFADAVRHALASIGADEEGGDRLLPALEAAAAPAEPLRRVLVRDQGRIFPLQVDAIEHLHSDTKYTALASRGRSYLVRLPITAFEQRLPSQFMKLSRACIVNLDCVESMVPDESSQLVVRMHDGTRYTASREVSKRLRADSL